MSRTIAVCLSVVICSLVATTAFAQSTVERVSRHTSLDRSQINNPATTQKIVRTRLGEISDIASFIRERLNIVRSANPVAAITPPGDDNASDGSAQEEQPQPANPSFLLTSLTFDQSHYLQSGILSEFNKQLAGRPINLQVLSAVPAIINEIYSVHGALTASAVLRPQTSASGVIHVSLIEPVIGAIRVSDVGRTTPAYIKRRIGAVPGQYPEFEQLAQNLFVFSTLNNINLTAQFEPTDSPNVVDMVLKGDKPRESTTAVTIDNHGPHETGEERVSGSFQHTNLTGRRDIVSVNGSASEGARKAGINYSFPVGLKGARISTGSVYSESRVVNGQLASIDLESQSASVYFSYQYPVIVEPDRIAWFGVSGDLERLATQISGVELTDSKIGEASLFTNWLWRTPNLTTAINLQVTFGDASSQTATSTDGPFQYIQGGLDMAGVVDNRLAVRFRMNGKYAISRNNPSSVLHSVGGVSTVRGYPEGLLSGDTGANISLELSSANPWSFDIGNIRSGLLGNDGELRTIDTVTVNPFVFFDAGLAVPFRSSGRAVRNEDVITSAGFGLNTNIAENLSANFTVSFPLRDTTGFDVALAGPKYNFAVTARF
ncbi:MAG: ShlB/FhaC/HecB family hemolysin secretion/activation protein [Hoeflea sp.]|uniref:ShlB/FhaC/HecB family hemolysin secretion/activation protein n=1 Tax=Hoeflea sp. TaxID=1940281 RepID=UPI003EF56002